MIGNIATVLTDICTFRCFWCLLLWLWVDTKVRLHSSGDLTYFLLHVAKLALKTVHLSLDVFPTRTRILILQAPAQIFNCTVRVLEVFLSALYVCGRLDDCKFFLSEQLLVLFFEVLVSLLNSLLVNLQLSRQLFECLCIYETLGIGHQTKTTQGTSKW